MLAISSKPLHVSYSQLTKLKVNSKKRTLDEDFDKVSSTDHDRGDRVSNTTSSYLQLRISKFSRAFNLPVILGGKIFNKLNIAIVNINL